MTKKARRFFLINLAMFIIILIAVFAIGVIILLLNSNQANAQETDENPPVISNIKILDTSATSTVITWETNEDADSLINFGLQKNYGIVRDPRADKKQHMIILEDLLPGTNYYFRITSTDGDGNQGISNNYSFVTEEDKPLYNEEGIEENFGKIISEEGRGGLKEKILEKGKEVLSEEVVDEVLQIIQEVITQKESQGIADQENQGTVETQEKLLAEIMEKIDMIQQEKILEQVDEQIEIKAQEVVKPPTIILDYADVEVGIDYAIISWATDKESNSMVALANEDEYRPGVDDPYAWNVGEPDESVIGHKVEVRGLTPSTVYHFQVSSESKLGLTGKSTDKTFKTKSIEPEIYNLQIAKVEEESATIKWMTNVPCSSIIEYTNLNNNQTKLVGNSNFITVHGMRLDNLIFDTYYSFIVKVESEEGESFESDPLTFLTIRDQVPPEISQVKTESTLFPGSENRIQTIISWMTDEESKCQLFYNRGLVVVDEPESLQAEEELANKHVEVATTFAPSTVYKFWINCQDEAGNNAKSDDFTMLTPTQEESIIDIIIKNFESSFGWLKKLSL